MKPTTKPAFRRVLPWFALTLLSAGSASAQLLLSDNFNEDPANDLAETFNDNLAVTQGGSLATKTYTIGSGNSNAAQHSNGGTQMTLASFEDGRSFGQVSLDHNFAAEANAADQPLQISFKLVDVFGYDSDTTRWVSFCVGEAANQFVTDPGAGIIFRKSGDVNTFGGIGGIGTWAAGDLVTITLSGTGGVGSAFDDGGSEATFTVGENTIGTFDLGQRTNAFLTFSAYNNFPTAIFGGGNLDDLNVSLISAVADPFANWMASNFPEIEAPDNTPTADPDNDGISNLLEYVLQGGDPSVSNTDILPTLDASGENFVFTYFRRTAATGTTQTFQYGSDLSGWTDVPVTDGGLVSIPAPVAGIEQVVITIPKGTETKLFGRLQVVK